MFDELKQGLKDAADILKHVKRPTEVVKALVPATVRGHRVLNEGDAAGGVRPDATGIDGRLRDLRSALEAESLSADGTVSYAGLNGSDTYAELERTARMLPAFDLATLDTDAKKNAFWINLYNVLAIHGVIALGIAKSVMEVPSFFGWVAYRVGPHLFTLDEIENGILRCNGRHPVTKRPLFAAGDPRLSLCPTEVDPRIHAALVCASTSCPAVRFYEADQLDAQLQLASQAYVAGAVRVHHDRRQVELPITFLYYAADYERGSVQGFLLTHAEGDQAEELKRAFDGEYTFDHQRYDWSINGRI